EYENTQKYYNEARICAQETKDSRKSEIDYYIACLNKSLFKFKEAKDQFRKIAIHDDNSIKYRSLASLELAEIAQNEGNLKEAIQEYQNALALSMGKDKTIVCSAYYKLALLYDENGDNENASYYYKKNFQTSSNRRENKYYSISLCNLAMISKENSIYDKALQYLKMALSFDSEIDDYENMYFCQIEIAKLYSNFDEEKSDIYFRQALNSANNLKDTFKIALCHFERGEHYYDRGNDKEALISYFKAKNSLKAQENDENLQRINSRIYDIKLRLDKTSFNLIAEQYDKI
ncbi:tetratricopeptide repeat protein, partial [bacterium]|nr:tetratricopeptide repeat protein [bacterium]